MVISIKRWYKALVPRGQVEGKIFGETKTFFEFIFFTKLNLSQSVIVVEFFPLHHRVQRAFLHTGSEGLIFRTTKRADHFFRFCVCQNV